MFSNVLFLASLADRVATHLSVDAAHWPVRAEDQRAIAVQWTAGEAGEELRRVIEALRARTIAPYRATRNESAIPLVTESEHEPARAVVTLWREARAAGGDGLRYTASFPGHEGTRSGWFALRAG